LETALGMNTQAARSTWQQLIMQFMIVAGQEGKATTKRAGEKGHGWHMENLPKKSH